MALSFHDVVKAQKLRLKYQSIRFQFQFISNCSFDKFARSLFILFSDVFV